MLSATRALQDKLFHEMKGRIKDNDQSAPFRKGGYYYYTKYVEGGEYQLFCRKKNYPEGPEEILVDGNALAKGQSFFNYRAQVSENGLLLAIASDTTGRRQYTLTIKDINSGKFLSDKISGAEPTVIWYNDNKTILYSKQDPTTLIANRIYKHEVGTDLKDDKLIYVENDSTLECDPYKTTSGKYIILNSSRTDANVQHFISADNPSSTPTLITPLEANVEYTVDEHNGEFYILTNDNAVNFKIAKTNVKTPAKKNWKDFVAEDKNSLKTTFKTFKNHLVYTQLTAGLLNINIYSWADGSTKAIQFSEPAYSASLGKNEEYNTDILQYEFQSQKTPTQTIEYNMNSGDQSIIKQIEILGGYNPEDYTTERVYAKSRDGKSIPISIVYKKSSFKKDGSNPCLQLGYGSYGFSYPINFDQRHLNYLSRGMVIAIAHIRGGSEMGGEWYADGRMLNKKNTFTDFIDCSEFLIANKYCAKDKLFASGGSAGGLLMGAISNMRPNLYKGIIALVPFVDVVTTMMDETIPLTTFEWKEWGNPNNKAEYDYMLSYSPYDNIEKKDYPNMLVITGLHDSQVQYWEPAKWVARLRATKTDHNLLLFKTNMSAGHGGASGRFQSMKDVALTQAFVLNLCGINQ